MKCLVVFLAVVGFGACADTHPQCYDSVVGACTRKSELTHCNATYGALSSTPKEKDLQEFAIAHIAHSFNYLLMSAHYGNFEADRPGFQRLLRKMSDSTWDDAVDLIKHLAKRGGGMDFNVESTLAADASVPAELHETASLAWALDSQKALAREAFRIHKGVSHGDHHDAELVSYMENHFVHKHADSIRDLSGHVNDLGGLLKGNTDPSLALFLFDEYLQKL